MKRPRMQLLNDYFYRMSELKEEPKLFMILLGSKAPNSSDGWREVRQVNGYDISVVLKKNLSLKSQKSFFFINLGGYKSANLQEQHYIF